MIQELKQKLKNNDIIYVLYKTIKDRKLCAILLRAYYQPEYKGCIYLVEHPGTVMPQETIYDISIGEDEISYSGFCAVMHYLLHKLRFANEYNLLPRVVWGKGSPYYEPEFVNITKNAFEYYFKPISEASKYQNSDFKNIMRSEVKHIVKYENMMMSSYKSNDDNIKMLAESFKKYIFLNDKTQDYIIKNKKNILLSNRVLGIHARGGDFKREFKKHPHHISPEEYLEKAKEEFASGKYKQIFLATDDENILKMFIDCFGDKLLYYNDVPRVSDNVGIHVKESSRPLHHYKLGLELLRDVYTLVSCRSFICGLSHVSFMVRYIKESLDEQFEKVIVLNKGINK